MTSLRPVLASLVAWLLPVAPVFAGAAGAAATAEHTLDNGVIQARVMDPNHPDRFNRGVRFTPLAAVLDVSRDGVEYLYSPEKHDPIHDHAGLAAEFDLCIPGGPPEHLPPGYEQAGVGEGFLKIGVGALKKGGKTYQFFQVPELLEAAKTVAEWSADAVFYRQEYRGAHTPGHAYRLEADLRLDGPGVVVEWRLFNTGRKPVTTRQYTHNFFRIADRDTGRGYVMSFPYDFQPRGLETGQRQEGRDICFVGAIPRWINAVVPWPEGYSGPNTLTLRHTEARRHIVCKTSLPGLRTDIHARAGYIAPEQFVEITIASGESRSWKRHYIFGKD
ncbi:MAG: hypothetical protein LBK99_03070 [Opitutaceae bacterium]|jgi:hypothetical protein|nr:hypothetical protein [Opitutaceae bacterium]